MIAVLQSTGIRRAEAAAATIERYDPGERVLRVTGQGNKDHTVYIRPDAVNLLGSWLVAVGVLSGPIFRSVDK